MMERYLCHVHVYQCSHHVRAAGHTFINLATAGLNPGVLMYCRNRVEILFLSPSRLASLTPRLIRSTSRSIKSTMSRVSGHSCSCPRE